MIICVSACGKQNSVDDNMAGLTASETEQNVILLENESRETRMEENIEGTETVLPYDSVFPEHKPYRTGVGAMPGRVVWAYDPASVFCDGNGYWWETDHFDESIILQI